MRKWLPTLMMATITVTVACTPISEQDEYYGAGFIDVSESTWSSSYASTYPFTVTDGEIACSLHPSFGRNVYFMPTGFTNESHIGTPLNQVAANSLKKEGIISNVPYTIKKDADLSDAIKAGLQVCDEQQDMLERG